MKKNSFRLVMEWLEDRRMLSTYYVTDSGIPGPCTFDDPCDLQTALSQPTFIKSGDTILVEGQFKGSFTSRLEGIKVDGQGKTKIDLFNGDRNRDVVFRIDGKNSIFTGFEVYSSDPNRASQQATPWPTDVNRGSVDVRGDHIDVNNFYVHDLGGAGIGWGHFAQGGSVTDSLIINVGWISVDRPHGHAIYAQNDGLHQKVIARNTIVNSYGACIHVYGEQVGISNIAIEENTLINCGGGQGVGFSRWPGILYGGAQPANNVVIRGNRTWQNGDGVTDLGYLWGSANNGKLTFAENYLVGMVRFNKPFSPVTFTDNTITVAAGPHIESQPAGTFTGNTLQNFPQVAQDAEIKRHQFGGLYTQHANGELRINGKAWLNEVHDVQATASQSLYVLRGDSRLLERSIPGGFEPLQFDVVKFHVTQDAHVYTVDRQGILRRDGQVYWDNVQDFHVDGARQLSVIENDGRVLTHKHGADRSDRSLVKSGASGTFTKSGELLATPTFVSGRFVTAYNWDRQAVISVTPAGLSYGQRFEVRSAVNPQAYPVYVGVWLGKPISLSATYQKAAQPVGSAKPTVDLDSRFQTFVVAVL